jgi:hypothetical protein
MRKLSHRIRRMSAAAVEPFRIMSKAREGRAGHFRAQSIMEEDSSQRRGEQLDTLESKPDDIIECYE